jgi:hypothetical protein
MFSDEEFNELQRIADALTRLADHFAPRVKKERGPATLGTAAYSEEEREKLRLRDDLKSKAASPPQT